MALTKEQRALIVATKEAVANTLSHRDRRQSPTVGDLLAALDVVMENLLVGPKPPAPAPSPAKPIGPAHAPAKPAPVVAKKA